VTLEKEKAAQLLSMQVIRKKRKKMCWRSYLFAKADDEAPEHQNRMLDLVS